LDGPDEDEDAYEAEQQKWLKLKRQREANAAKDNGLSQSTFHINLNQVPGFNVGFKPSGEQDGITVHTLGFDKPHGDLNMKRDSDSSSVGSPGFMSPNSSRPGSYIAAPPKPAPVPHLHLDTALSQVKFGPPPKVC
jgi:hypothetical protein